MFLIQVTFHGLFFPSREPTVITFIYLILPIFDRKPIQTCLQGYLCFFVHNDQVFCQLVLDHGHEMWTLAADVQPFVDCLDVEVQRWFIIICEVTEDAQICVLVGHVELCDPTFKVQGLPDHR